MKWKNNKPIKILLFIAIPIVLLPVGFFLLYLLFGGDWGIDLPGGYFLSSIYGGAVEITDSPKNIVVYPNIETYKVYEQKHLVVGRVSNEGLQPREVENSVPGYFILNTENGLLLQGLEEKVWLDSLRRYGITQKPRLHKPTGFDRNY